MGLIGLTAVNGRVGSHVVRSAIQSEHPFVAIVRNPSSLPKEVALNVEHRIADLTDAGQLTEAVRGLDTLWCVIPENVVNDPEAEYRRIADAYVHAVSFCRVRRVVLQSSVGTESASLGGGELRGLRYAEESLAQTGVHLRVLRCGYFTSNLAPLFPLIVEQGVLPTSMSLDLPMPWVDPRDVAAVSAGLLFSPHWTGQEFRAVHGPIDLSWRDVAGILSKVFSRDVQPVQISDDDFLANLVKAGLPRGMAVSISETAALMRRGFEPEQRRSVFSTTPTSLAEWATSQHLSYRSNPPA